jgi:uncharacterized protein (TIGR02145 family)
MKSIFRNSVIIFTIQIVLAIYSCKKNKPDLPEILTGTITDITFTTAISGGIIANDGGTPILSKGLCWDISEYPTTENQKTTEGSGAGSFTSEITQLTPNTLYYLRAYATNIAGTAYGNQLTFITSGTTEDADGNIYNSVIIGKQTWMKENLRTTRYSNGDAIPLFTGRLDWYYLVSPGYCYYDNTLNNLNTYGAFYNWYTLDASSNGHRNICPTGWHVPTYSDWSVLISYLGGDSVAADKLKETGEIHWLNPNNGATNESDFSALPGGGRDYNGAYYDIGSYGHWWSSTEFVDGGAWSLYLGNDTSRVYRQRRFEQDGFSVRCIKDD